MSHTLDGAFHLDLETRNWGVDLRRAGPFVYGEHFSTEVWCAAYARGDEEPRLWFKGQPAPRAIIEAAADPDVPFVAHNVGFERALILTNLAPRHGWPVIPRERWYCSAALAAAMSLPRDLAGACRVMGVEEQKDMGGNALIKRMMKPYRTERAPCLICGQSQCEHHEKYRLRLFYHETPEEIARGGEYCRQDVRAERALLKRLRMLNATERRAWLLDQLINERGVRIDMDFVLHALRLVQPAVEYLNREEQLLTGYGGALGAIKTSQVEKLRWWLAMEGVAAKDLSRDTIAGLLADNNLDKRVKQALELRKEASKTSTAKLKAFQKRVSLDGRMRDNLMYHGAGTGRFSGRGAQLQNLPSRFTLKAHHIAAAIEMVRHGCSAEDLKTWVDPSTLEVISACLRGAIVAADGKEFVVADHNAIEARVLAWLANAPGLLGVFARDEDPYLYQASLTYDIPLASMSKATHSKERGLGKIQVLGLGYQMGPDKFIASCAKERILITKSQAVQYVAAYREGNPEVPELWDEGEEAAMRAVNSPGQIYEWAGGKLAFQCLKNWLYLRLPSGRLLSYPGAHLAWREVPWIDQRTGRKAKRLAVCFYGIDSLTHKWTLQSGYGGKWVENADQATARDVLVEGMFRVEEAGYPVVLSVHDEIVSEVEKGWGAQYDYVDDDGKTRPGEYERLMCELPAWAAGMPVRAEGWRGGRYKK